MKSALLLLLPLVLAADASKPHPHQGVIPAFKGAPPATELTNHELGEYHAGRDVLKQMTASAGGQGVAVFKVNAPAKDVWSVIMDHSKYPAWIDDLKKTEIYKREDKLVYTHFLTRVMGVTVEWYIRHVVNTKNGWVTWTLDYDRLSDLDDSVGFWRVTPARKNPNICRVEYSVNLRLQGWVPGFLKKILVDQGLQDATTWVKVQSEARFNKK
jgi:ribosome-associated toxin RatA of RatAB toxin-antitoxin module